MRLRFWQQGEPAPAAGAPQPVEQVVVQLDADQLKELSTVFSAPRWLRDLGLASWFLVGVGALLLGLTWVLGVTSTIVEPVITGGVVAIVASPGVSWLQRHRVPRALGALIVLLALAAVGVVILLLVLGGIVAESGQISAAVSAAADKIQGWMQDVGVDSSAASSANANVSSSVPSIDLHVVQGRRERHPGNRIARLRRLVHALRHLLPAQGRAGVPCLGEPASRRAAVRRRDDHRRSRHRDAPVLPRCHDRRDVQCDRRRCRRLRARRPTRRHDRGRDLRHGLRPVRRCRGCGRVRRSDGARRARDDHRA